MCKTLIFHGARKGNTVALSFDDGPDIGEAELISALTKAGIKVTFFWIPQKVEDFRANYQQKFSEILWLIQGGGHEIGIHGLTCKKPSFLERFQCESMKDMISAQKNFCSYLGYKPTLYRLHCVRCFRTPEGMKTILGSHLPIGQKGNLAAKYLSTFAKAKAGDIICGHDSKGCSLDSGIASAIAKIVPQIKQKLEDRRLICTTISEVI